MGGKREVAHEGCAAFDMRRQQGGSCVVVLVVHTGGN